MSSTRLLWNDFHGFRTSVTSEKDFPHGFSWKGSSVRCHNPVHKDFAIWYIFPVNSSRDLTEPNKRNLQRNKMVTYGVLFLNNLTAYVLFELTFFFFHNIYFKIVKSLALRDLFMLKCDYQTLNGAILSNY